MSNDVPNPLEDDDAVDIDPAALDDLAALLSDAAMWEPSDPEDEAAIMAAISELSAGQADASTPATAPVISLPVDRSEPAPRRTAEPTGQSNVVPISRARRWAAPFAAGIAAALALVVGVSALTGDAERETIELALAGTDLAPEAEGLVEIAETPNGTVLLLDVSGLPPAPEGSYYEAWVRQSPEVGVSAGTFHLRGGGGNIELWAGVSTDDYPLFTITIQDEADPVSSGQVVLKGLLDG